MKKVIGWIILGALILALIVGTCVIVGAKEGLLIWFGSLVIAVLMAFAMYLIDG